MGIFGMWIRLGMAYMTHVVSVPIFFVAASTTVTTTTIFAANWKMSQFILFLCLIGFCLAKFYAPNQSWGNIPVA